MLDGNRSYALTEKLAIDNRTSAASRIMTSNTLSQTTKSGDEGTIITVLIHNDDSSSHPTQHKQIGFHSVTNRLNITLNHTDYNVEPKTAKYFKCVTTKAQIKKIY